MPDAYENLRPLQRRFLKCFEACASITQAARWAKTVRQMHYDWMEADPEYAAAFRLAEPRANRTLEDEAVRRAHQGIKKAIRYKGKIIAYDREYSDTLLLALIRAGNPEKYRERFDNRHSGPNGEKLLDLDSVRAFMATRDTD